MHATGGSNPCNLGSEWSFMHRRHIQHTQRQVPRPPRFWFPLTAVKSSKTETITTTLAAAPQQNQEETPSTSSPIDGPCTVNWLVVALELCTRANQVTSGGGESNLAGSDNNNSTVVGGLAGRERAARQHITHCRHIGLTAARRNKESSADTRSSFARQYRTGYRCCWIPR